MIEYSFKIQKSYTSVPEFSEASREELRVLLALMSKDGEVTLGELARLASVGEARCKSCIAFWQGADVIRHRDDKPFVTEEFEGRLYSGELLEMEAKEVAKTIRDKALSDLFYDIAKVLEKPELSPMEVKRITQLTSQYGLSAEYIATLCAYLSEKGEVTVNALVSRGVKLAENGVDTVAALEEYIAYCVELQEIRKALGIYNRKLSPTEEKYIKKWSYDYGYGALIIGEAYDITVVSTNKVSFPYMDKILEDWHECGCKTLEECKVRNEETKSQLRLEYESKTNDGKKSDKKKAPRYGDFDPEEALKRALNRSFAPSSVPESEENK